MNGYLIFILAVLLGSYILDQIVRYLNLKSLSSDLPEEFVGHYDGDKYAKSQQYSREGSRFGVIVETFDIILIVGFILWGGFNWIDNVARSLGWSAIPTGLLFVGILGIGSQLLHLPFSIYSTFVIEEKYGFNLTTAKTFVLDLLKGLLLTIIIGGAVLALILWFFVETGELAWLYVWVALTIFQIFMMFIAPVVIMPIFNKFTPLEDGELKDAILQYTAKQDFKMGGIFTIDGSRRSSKANAFFTGFGKFKRIALFDTLIEKQSVSELLCVLAHEIGHSKLGHIPKRIITSILSTGLMLFILSLFINSPGLFEAFRMDNISIYASITFFSFIYSPVSMVIGLANTITSRRHEYQADRYAAQTTGNTEAMITALKKLSVSSLSNLTPHPLKVFLEYDHPPVLDRIKALRAL